MMKNIKDMTSQEMQEVITSYLREAFKHKLGQTSPQDVKQYMIGALQDIVSSSGNFISNIKVDFSQEGDEIVAKPKNIYTAMFLMGIVPPPGAELILDSYECDEGNFIMKDGVVMFSPKIKNWVGDIRISVSEG
jgi:hypothetical protein